MNYSIDEYRNSFQVKGKVMSRDTIRRMIENNQLPSNHIAKRHGLQWIIEVSPNNSQLADIIAACCSEYYKINKAEILSISERVDKAIELAHKYDLKPNTILRILGL